MPHVLITGTSRGIGRAFVEQYAAAGWQVTATVRTEPQAPIAANVDLRRLDVAAPQTFADFARRIDRPIDVLINNAGRFGPRPQTSADVTPELFAEVMTVNALAPLLLTRALLAQLRAGTAKKLVTITSRMGAFSENANGSAPAYRASKAALNMLMRSLSFEVGPQGLGVLLLHPGWVRTDMGTDAADLDVEASVTGMRAVIDAFDPAEQVAFRNWDGRAIAW